MLAHHTSNTSHTDGHPAQHTQYLEYRLTQAASQEASQIIQQQPTMKDRQKKNSKNPLIINGILYYSLPQGNTGTGGGVTCSQHTHRTNIVD